jgi:hypothetical protein
LQKYQPQLLGNSWWDNLPFTNPSPPFVAVDVFALSLALEKSFLGFDVPFFWECGGLSALLGASIRSLLRVEDLGGMGKEDGRPGEALGALVGF